MCVTDNGTEFVNQAKESYKLDEICHIVCQTLMKDCKDPSLCTKLDEIWKKAHDEGRFHLLEGTLYHRTKNTFSMTPTDRVLINTILHEFNDSVVSGDLSERGTLERLKNSFGGQIGERMLQNISRIVKDYKKKMEPQARNFEW
ncbi:hypothetical protein O181_005444 [Austropuccinia psidii MF-1]|uniref:Uncharacterized protein n=1 Tax=Austropuccinia psidii MF-1 TaxID=1389203 RepID=A0A9Q3GFW2_9BASI|nr:hypothetical protein [Austropuccinia psidii MF-1]